MTNTQKNNKNPFVRETFFATQHQLIKPELLIREWQSALASLKEVKLKNTEAWYQLLVLTGRLRRTDKVGEMSELLQWAKTEIDKINESEYRTVVRMFSLEDWQAAVEKLQELDEIQGNEVEAAMLTRQWDDIGILSAYSLNTFGESFYPATDKIWYECFKFLLDKGDSVLSLASDWIQTVAATFDPNLKERHDEYHVDDELAMTMDGIAEVLDKLEKTEKLFNGDPDTVRDFVKEMAKKFISKPILRKRIIIEGNIPLMNAADDGNDMASQTLIKSVSCETDADTPEGKFHIQRILYENWDLKFYISSKDNGESPKIDCVQIDDIQAERVESTPTCWQINLRNSKGKTPYQLLNAPTSIHFS